MRLVLFDIDGTLLHCGPQVAPIFLDALEQVFGVRGDTATYSFAGRTDPQIVFDLMRAAGVGESEIVDGLQQVHDRYVVRLEEELDVRQMRLLPAVEPLLESLAGRDDLVLGLLTGNWHRGARAKLERFGLNRYFSFGGFGEDGVVRQQLFHAGVDRALETCGKAFPAHEVLLVGDTELDVECAVETGAKILAVATGRTTEADLRAAGASWVVEDLTHAVGHPALAPAALASAVGP